jgi:hypothetical protein
MREGIERALPGVIELAYSDPDPKVRIKATELLCRYGIGERVEVDQQLAPAVVMLIAQRPEDPGWPCMISVERKALPAPAEGQDGQDQKMGK